MKVLVTGAAGFIGSHLVEECLRRGWSVVAIDSLNTNYSPSAKVRNADHFRRHHRCTYLEQDILDADLPSLLEGTAVVFHLAAQAGVRASWGQSFDLYTQLNVTVLQRLLEAVRDTAVERFVFASSSSVYGDAESLPTPEDMMLRPVSPYGATKALGEHLTYLYHRNYGVPTVNLRYFSVYGPRQRPDMAFHRAIEAALTGVEFRLFGDGGQTRDFSYVADIIEGTLSAAEHAPPGSTYNLGGGSKVSMLEVLEIINSESGGALRITHEPSQQGDARDTAADITAARRDLSYAPSLPCLAVAERFVWLQLTLGGCAAPGHEGATLGAWRERPEPATSCAASIASRSTGCTRSLRTPSVRGLPRTSPRRPSSAWSDPGRGTTRAVRASAPG